MTVPTDGRPIGFWLKLVDRLIDKRLEASLGGLSRRHWQVLNVVRKGRASQAEIDARVRPFIGADTGQSVDPNPPGGNTVIWAPVQLMQNTPSDACH